MGGQKIASALVAVPWTLLGYVIATAATASIGKQTIAE